MPCPFLFPESVTLSTSHQSEACGPHATAHPLLGLSGKLGDLNLRKVCGP